MWRTYKAYYAYLKDNPEGYWFKRKLYGWGWTPATREGWFVMLLFIGFVLFVVVRAQYVVQSDSEALYSIVAPIIVAGIVFVIVCWKTGEPPAWQWDLPEKYFED